MAKVIERALITFHRFSTKPLYSFIDYGKKSSVSRYLWQASDLWNIIINKLEEMFRESVLLKVNEI